VLAFVALAALLIVVPTNAKLHDLTNPKGIAPTLLESAGLSAFF